MSTVPANTATPASAALLALTSGTASAAAPGGGNAASTGNSGAAPSFSEVLNSLPQTNAPLAISSAGTPGAASGSRPGGAAAAPPLTTQWVNTTFQPQPTLAFPAATNTSGDATTLPKSAPGQPDELNSAPEDVTAGDALENSITALAAASPAPSAASPLAALSAAVTASSSFPPPTLAGPISPTVPAAPFVPEELSAAVAPPALPALPASPASPALPASAAPFAPFAPIVSVAPFAPATPSRPSALSAPAAQSVPTAPLRFSQQVAPSAPALWLSAPAAPLSSATPPAPTTSVEDLMANATPTTIQTDVQALLAQNVPNSALLAVPQLVATAGKQNPNGGLPVSTLAIQGSGAQPLPLPLTDESANSAPPGKPAASPTQTSDSGADDNDPDSASNSTGNANSNSDLSRLPLTMALPFTWLMQPIPVNFAPATTDGGSSDSGQSSDAPAISAAALRDAYAQTTPVNVLQVSMNAAAFAAPDPFPNMPQDAAHQTAAPNTQDGGSSGKDASSTLTPAQAGAAEQLDEIQELLQAMTPVHPAHSASAAAAAVNTLGDESANFAVRTSSTAYARAAQPQDALNPLTSANGKTSGSNATMPAAATFTTANAAPANPAPMYTLPVNAMPSGAASVFATPANASPQIQSGMAVSAQTTNPDANPYAALTGAHDQTSAAQNAPQNSTQPPALPNDQHSVAATFAAAGNSADSTDRGFGQERQHLQDAQFAAPAKTETFAANAFSAVAPGGYWSEKTADAAPAQAAPVFKQVLDALPKPLQATTITIRPEGFGTIQIRVVPQPQDSLAPWRITIRTSDTSAHALLSQSVAELRQNLRSDSGNMFGSLQPAQKSGPGSTPNQQGTSDFRGGRRQEFEQRQRNRSRGFIFEVPELEA